MRITPRSGSRRRLRYAVALLLAASGVPLGVGTVASAAPTAAAVVSDTAGPMPTTLVLPAGYADRHWPVVYWLNVVYDGCAPNDCGPVLDELRAEPYISVLPSTSAALAEYVDWRDGSHDGEASYLRLVRHIDATYRTIGDRAHRVVTGISAGGYGAALLAGDHPDVFGGLASFSGILDLTSKTPLFQAVFVPTSQNPPPNIPSPDGVYGAPGVHDIGWHAANPRDLLRNLRATALFDSAGRGVPCAGEDPSGTPFEAIVRDTSHSFARQADRLDVRHTSLRLSCGVHDYVPTFQSEIRAWLARPLAARAIPSVFTYRSVRPQFGVYGWRFTTDPKRAPEWLSAYRVSSSGLTLRGSGNTTVDTPRLFRPRERLTVRDASGSHNVRASRKGALHLVVDLGAPHPDEQYTLAQRMAARGGDYWTTVRVSFIRRR